MDADINGEWFRIDPRHRVFVQPDYEADVARYQRESMRPGQRALDISAHIGVYALQMARWTAPGGRDPSERVEEAALGRAQGASSFFGGAGSGASRLWRPNPKSREPGMVERTVQLQTVDAYCAAVALAEAGQADSEVQARSTPLATGDASPSGRRQSPRAARHLST